MTLPRSLICTLALFAAACFDFTEPDEVGEPGERPGMPRTVDEPTVDEPAVDELAAPGAQDGEPALPLAPAVTPACLAPYPDDMRAVRRVRQVAEASVHELVTCGGAQMSVVNSMVARVLLSNPQFFDAETIDTLKSVLGLDELAFDRTPAGKWRMEINDGSAFDLQFFLPGGAQAETSDVFDLEAYLKGAQVETSLSFDEMLADLDRQNTYVVRWDAYGELADLMFPDGRPAVREFTVRLSLLDFVDLYFGTSDAESFGPFGNLVDLEIDSHVDLVDRRNSVDVAYTFASARQPLARLYASQAVPFELHALAATDGRVTLQGAAADLSVEGRGSLSGVLIYAVDGIAVDDVRVVDDFGEGAAYPEASYWCPADWTTSPYAAPDVME